MERGVGHDRRKERGLADAVAASTASEPASGTSSATSSRSGLDRIRRSPCRRSASGMRLAQVDVAHAPVGGDLVWRAPPPAPGLRQDGNAAREADTRSMACSMIRWRCRRQRAEDFEDAAESCDDAGAGSSSRSTRGLRPSAMGSRPGAGGRRAGPARAAGVVGEP